MTPARSFVARALGARAALVLAALGPFALAACQAGPDGPPEGVAAQVGDAVLTEDEVARRLAVAPAGLDSASARRAVVDPWVRRELLVQEARAENLDDDPDVRERLADAERAVLEEAALDHLFASEGAEPAAADIEAYYTRNRSRFTLRGPAVRIRHLRVRGGGSREGRARAAAEALRRVAASAGPDSTFALAAREFSDDPAGAVALAASYVPETRLASTDSILALAVASLQPGGRVVMVPSGPTVHVVQLVDRLPAGAILPLAAVRDDIAERLGVGLRTDRAARLVERLRAEAEARHTLRVR